MGRLSPDSALHVMSLVDLVRVSFIDGTAGQAPASVEMIS